MNNVEHINQNFASIVPNHIKNRFYIWVYYCETQRVMEEIHSLL